MKTPTRTAIVCLLLLCLPAIGQGQELVVHRDLTYAKAGEHELKVDLYLAKEYESKPPLVVWIHGGGWRQGSKDRCPFKWLAEEGYAVASVQYRLTDKARFPAQIHDCKAAIRWLRASAEKYGYDAKRIGAVGISAGGHLVALLGTSGGVKELEGKLGEHLDQSSRVQAVLDMCGPTDFILRWKENPEKRNSADSPVGLLLGGAVSEKQELARLASPASHVTKDDAPLRIVHGTNDPLVSPRQSEHLRDLYQKAGLEVTLELIQGGGHVPREFFDKTRRELTLEFFDKHIKQK